MVHNETVNIWSHLVGFILVLLVLYDLFFNSMEKGHVFAKIIARSFSSDIISSQQIWV
jgi:predicted membrane channel-forming protein YqfA (hemolysin III family)